MKKIIAYLLSFALSVYPTTSAFAQATPGSTIQGSSTFANSTTILPGTAFCQLGSDQHPAPYCIDSTPCKTIDGHRTCLSNAGSQPASTYFMSGTCWTYSRDYTCLQYQDNCVSYRSDTQCVLSKSECVQNASGQLAISTMGSANIPAGCLSVNNTYTCTRPSTKTNTETVSCTTSGTMNGLTWETNSPSSAADMVKAAAAQEFARQVAANGNDGPGDGFNGLFMGVPMGCREGWVGLKHCCKGDATAVNNNQFMQTAGITATLGAFKAGASYAYNAGSKYVYETIGNNTDWLQDSVAAMGDRTTFDTGVGVMGFGTSAASASGVLGSTGAVNGALVSEGGTTYALGESGLYFNPYAFALAVGISVVMAAMSCNQEEEQLAQAKSKNLCHAVGDYCSKEINLLVGKVCVETTTKYCCYNGLLSRAIEEGAHAQLGLSWGSSQNPICGGGLSPNPNALTIDQLTLLDFSSPSMQEAFKPFEQQIIDNYNSTAKPAIANGSIQTDASNTATATSSALCQQRKKLVPSTVCN